MALGDAYMTVENYRAQYTPEADGGGTTMERDLLGASDFWNEKLRRETFWKHDAASERPFYVDRSRLGGGSEWLYVDDIASIAGLVVSVNGTTVDADDYELWPLNALDKGRPYEAIRSKKSSRWPLGDAITVTAVWGWPALPPLIEMLTGEWCAVWRGDSARATGQINELDQVVSASPWHQSQVKRAGLLYQRARRPVVVTF